MRAVGASRAQRLHPPNAIPSQREREREKETLVFRISTLLPQRQDVNEVAFSKIEDVSFFLAIFVHYYESSVLSVNTSIWENLIPH